MTHRICSELQKYIHVMLHREEFLFLILFDLLFLFAEIQGKTTIVWNERGNISSLILPLNVNTLSTRVSVFLLKPTCFSRVLRLFLLLISQSVRRLSIVSVLHQEVVELIGCNRVLVVSGETGCGKTTQVTQFILDDYINRGKGSLCRIVCTQPRRISAISVCSL